MRLPALCKRTGAAEMIWLLWSILVTGVVVLDCVTKYLTVQYLKPIGDLPLIEGWLHLTYVENTGAAFGMLKDQRWLFIIVSSLGILALIALLIWKGKQISLPGTVALCMVIGGGIGNQIDRIVQGYVVDMIYVKIIDFAVFNVADSFVCIGVGILLICCFTVDKALLEDSPKEKASTVKRVGGIEGTCEEDPLPEAAESPDASAPHENQKDTEAS